MQDKTNKEERLTFIAERLGYGRSILKEYQDRFGVSQARFYEDRKEVLHRMEDRLDGNLEDYAKDLLERYEHIYQEALGRRDLKTAEKVLKDIAELKGLGVQKLEVKADNTIELQWGIENE